MTPPAKGSRNAHRGWVGCDTVGSLEGSTSGKKPVYNRLNLRTE